MGEHHPIPVVPRCAWSPMVSRISPASIMVSAGCFIWGMGWRTFFGIQKSSIKITRVFRRMMWATQCHKPFGDGLNPRKCVFWGMIHGIRWFNIHQHSIVCDLGPGSDCSVPMSEFDHPKYSILRFPWQTKGFPHGLWYFQIYWNIFPNSWTVIIPTTLARNKYKIL